MISAKIIADSISLENARITTFVLKYPRFIHSEVMTHRAFSRNAASSRAIPISTMIKRVVEEPAMPEYWGANQKGMQAAAELSPEDISICKKIWLRGRDEAVAIVEELDEIGLHKQIANRILEPWMHMEALVTATNVGNFFNLRAHREAQPEFQRLAAAMLREFMTHKPTLKKPGEWHLPFADQYMAEGLTLEQMQQISTARAARVSYVNFEGDFDHAKDYDLHARLEKGGHWSPFEHAAYPACTKYVKSGNFTGWHQYRKMFPGENRENYDGEALLRALEA